MQNHGCRPRGSGYELHAGAKKENARGTCRDVLEDWHGATSCQTKMPSSANFIGSCSRLMVLDTLQTLYVATLNP